MATTPNFNWSTPDNTGLVKNGALDIRTLGNSIDASMADLKGGTTGQVLTKATNTDMDFTWSSPSAGMTNPMTTTGDTIYSSSGSTPARLAIGTTGQVLTVAGGVPTWASPAGGGKLLQVVAGTTTTEKTIATTTYTDTNITATITPTSASSRILVLITSAYSLTRSSDELANAGVQLLRGATTLLTNDTVIGFAATNGGATSTMMRNAYSLNYMDSPATTSSQTYKLQSRVATTSSAAQIQWQYNNQNASIMLLEIGA